MIQFLKSGDWSVGEEEIGKQVGMDWWALGDGFTWDSSDMDESQAIAREAWSQAQNVIAAGEHELVAFFTGQGPHERDYRRGATIVFEKGIGPKYIELQISDRESKLQPEFVVREWD